jgi:hypothetical protein
MVENKNKKKEIKDILQGADIVKFITSLRIRWNGFVEIMQNHRTPKRILTATTKGTRKRGGPRER